VAQCNLQQNGVSMRWFEEDNPLCVGPWLAHKTESLQGVRKKKNPIHGVRILIKPDSIPHHTASVVHVVPQIMSSPYPYPLGSF
jgi:hypothetical protein